jgi:hypothetical protein
MNTDEQILSALNKLVEAQAQTLALQKQALETQQQALANQQRAIKNQLATGRIYRLSLLLLFTLIAIAIGIYCAAKWS